MNKQIKVATHKLEVKDEGAFTPEQRPGGWTILKNEFGHRFKVRAKTQQGKFWVHLVHKTIYGSFIEKQRASQGGGASDADLTAQFPGKVRKILVKDGEHVEEGASLMLLEAMKMEFPIKAPTAGTVQKLLVQEGATLTPGTRLVDFKSDPND